MNMTRERRPHDTRRRAVTDAAASPYLATLTLAELRSYRLSLVAEEERTSYWRRLVQARIDLLDAGGTAEDSLSMAQLTRALGDTGTGRSRNALHRVRAAEPLPDLPALEDVWVLPADGVGRLDALCRLSVAEQRLTDYRTALHARIDEATAELICRYREDPSLALAALPA
jgi:hypothetical protein